MHWYQGVVGSWFLGTTVEMLNLAVHPGNTTSLQFSEYAAYRIDDIFRAVKVLGEKDGWYKETRCICGGSAKSLQNEVSGEGDSWCTRCGSDWLSSSEFEHGNAITEIEYTCHRLLTAYLDDNCEIGENTERVVRGIFTNTRRNK